MKVPSCLFIEYKNEALKFEINIKQEANINNIIIYNGLKTTVHVSSRTIYDMWGQYFVRNI